jgi:diguanylate cyclase
VSDISAVVSEVSKLKQRLDQAQLSYRDASLKSRREIVILKRLITRLSVACRGLDEELDTKLTELRCELEQPKDISKLIPRLAIIERLVTRQAGITEKENLRIENQIHQSGETLKRVRGLPAQLKRDLRNLLNNTSTSLTHSHQRIIALVELYERSLKLLSVSTENVELKDMLDHDIQHQLTNELQHLISELDFDGESGDKLLTIRNRLLIGVPPQALLELALEVIRLVLDSTHQERRSSQKFLDGVNGDLATLQKTTNQYVGQSSALYEHRGGLNNELSTIVTTVKKGLSEHKNLETWRPQITELTKELQVLADRNRALEKREKTLIEQLSYNENKITTLFEQTQDYRQRLNDQERKMFLDHLTKVYNCAALNDRLEHEYRRWLRYQHPLCVALIDIDNFKEINDSYGHVAGDKALKIIARTIHQCLEETDFIARYKSDEFMIIMPDINEDNRTKSLNKIRETVAQLPFRFKEQNVSITISIGATLFEGNDTPADITERTSKALDNAKNSGRNRFIWIY